MRTSSIRAAVGLFLVLSGGLTAPALAQRDPEVTVAKSLQVISQITRNPKNGMPRLVMRKAEGFAIVPDMFKMSFIFGARFGRGLLVIRQPDGAWSNPVFIHLVGGSFGAQAGAQSTDLVLVFQTRRGLDRFLKGKGKLTLGVDVGAAAGPVGKRFEASTDVALKSEILSYSNTRGIFAGVSAEGGTLQIDGRANTLYYNQPVPPGAILAVNSKLAVPPSTISLQQLLAEKTAWPEHIVRSRKTRGEPAIIDEEMVVEEFDDAEADRTVRRRTSPKPETRPQAEPGDDDDLEAIPPPFSPSSNGGKTSGRSRKPQRPNDEDLPQALPEEAPARPKTRPKPAPAKPDGDEVPRLDPPK